MSYIYLFTLLHTLLHTLLFSCVFCKNFGCRTPFQEALFEYLTSILTFILASLVSVDLIYIDSFYSLVILALELPDVKSKLMFLEIKDSVTE